MEYILGFGLVLGNINKPMNSSQTLCTLNQLCLPCLVMLRARYLNSMLVPFIARSFSNQSKSIGYIDILTVDTYNPTICHPAISILFYRIYI